MDYPELAKALKQIEEEKFAKLMAYLSNPLSRRVRTNNHVERTNRMFGFLEKVGYKSRRRKILVRFIVLKLDVIWSERTSDQRKEDGRSTSAASGRTEDVRGKRSQAA